MTEWIEQSLHLVAAHPEWLYPSVLLLLTASSFGLPIPEEVVLLTAGAVANVAYRDGLEAGLPSTVSAVGLALTCFMAVLSSDLLVFWLGRRFGVQMLRRGPLAKLMSPARLTQVQEWTQRYGTWACGVFRFTPGIRFPGHFMCGSLGISYTRFLIVDGLAALTTVPTQVLLMAYYGDEILGALKSVKLALLSVALVALAFWFIRKRARKTPSGSRGRGRPDQAA